jgi:hypothetical protein
MGTQRSVTADNLNMPGKTTRTLITLMKAVIISIIVLMLADYFALPFFAEAGGA